MEHGPENSRHEAGPPVTYAFTSLTPTAHRLLEAAHRVLERDGYEGLTLRRIADEAGETKSLIIYHFESKAGLVAHLVDFLWHDADVALRERVESVAGPEGARLEALIDLHEALARDATAYRLYFELLPQVARDEDTRARVVDFYRAYRAFGADCIRWVAPGEAAAAPLAAALLAIGEGVPVQTLVVSEPAPAAVVFGLLREVVRSYLGLDGSARAAPPAFKADPVSATPRHGRPRTDPPAEAPVADPTSDLTPVAAAVLHSATAVLRRDGLRALTLDAVAAESGEPRSSVSYHLGDKRAMLLRVLDLINHGSQALLDRPEEDLGEQSRRSLHVYAQRALLDLEGRRTFFELLPAMLRDPELKAREDTYTEWVLARLTAGAAGRGVPAALEYPLASAFLALVHGLSMQALVEPDTFDPLPALEAWSAAVDAWTAAGSDRGDHAGTVGR